MIRIARLKRGLLKEEILHQREKPQRRERGGNFISSSPFFYFYSLLIFSIISRRPAKVPPRLLKVGVLFLACEH